MEEGGDEPGFFARSLWQKMVESIINCHAQQVIANGQGYDILKPERWQEIHHYVHAQEVPQQLEDKDKKFIRRWQKVTLNADSAIQMLFDEKGRKWIHRGQLFEELYGLWSIDQSTTCDQLCKTVKHKYNNISNKVVEDFFRARYDLLPCHWYNQCMSFVLLYHLYDISNILLYFY
jgi:hypothetical protein